MAVFMTANAAKGNILLLYVISKEYISLSKQLLYIFYKCLAFFNDLNNN